MNSTSYSWFSSYVLYANIRHNKSPFFSYFPILYLSKSFLLLFWCECVSCIYNSALEWKNFSVCEYYIGYVFQIIHSSEPRSSFFNELNVLWAVSDLILYTWKTLLIIKYTVVVVVFVVQYSFCLREKSNQRNCISSLSLQLLFGFNVRTRYEKI